MANYTEIYKKVYAGLTVCDLPHEDIHRSALAITNGLWDIHLKCGENEEACQKAVDSTIESIASLTI